MEHPLLLERLQELHTQFFLALNHLRHPVLDPVMALITGKPFWYPFYIALAVFIIYKERLWAGLWTLGGLTVSIGLSDLFTSRFMKPFFAVLRPCHNQAIAEHVHTLNEHCGGLYGFASSHAANSFALATFGYLAFSKRYAYRALTIALFVYASLVSYSRIYAGVHYPADVVVGAAVGSLMAYVIYALGKRLPIASTYRLK